MQSADQTGVRNAVAVQERLRELRVELEGMVESDPILQICPADAASDGEDFAGGFVIRPREPAPERYAEMRIGPCVAEIMLRPESSSIRSILTLEEGYSVDTCETGSASELARVLLATLESHLEWLAHASDPEA